MSKAVLKTFRISQKDYDIIEQFQKANPIFDNFSTLVRVAIFDLISKRSDIPLRPIVRLVKRLRPSFIWDYDLNETEIHEILSGPRAKARWMIARILEHGRFDEIWHYLTLETIANELPNLRLPKKVKDHWEYAIKRWKRNDENLDRPTE